jgi:hypothetical protein
MRAQLARSAWGWHDHGSEVLVLKTLRLLALTASFGAVVAIGCSGDDKDGSTGLPPRNSNNDKDGGETNASSSGGSSGGSSGTPSYDCTSHAPVDDRPACDQCARSKCCEWITKCDGSPSCKAAQDCIGACSADDFPCVLGCSATAGTGGTFLEELGACVSNSCKAECPSTTGLDAGFDAF